MKRILSLFLILCMLMAGTPGAWAAEEMTDDGSITQRKEFFLTAEKEEGLTVDEIGNTTEEDKIPEPMSEEENTDNGDILWALDENGVLTVSGNGRMPSWTESEPLWFENKDQILKLVIEEGVTSAAEQAFASCAYLAEVSLPDTLESIGKSAFEDCAALREITLPQSVAEIGEKAFCGCEELTEIVFEGAAPVIGAYAFGNVTADVIYAPTDRSWSGVAYADYGGVLNWRLTGEGDVEGYDIHWVIDRDGVLTISGSGDIPASDFGGTNAPWTLYGRGEAFTSLIIEEGVTGIGDYAFNYCQKIGNIVIPSGVTFVGEYAFFPYIPLKTLSIPETVKSIGECAFFASDISTLVLHEGLESIGEGAFCGCNYLTAVSIPASVTLIETDVFGDCMRLSEIIFNGPAPEIGKYAFSSVTANAYYPANDMSWDQEVMKDYGGHITWKTVRNIVAGGVSGKLSWAVDDAGLLTVNGEGAMANYSLVTVPWRLYQKKIRSLEIGEGVTSVGRNAFRKCVRLRSVSLPGTLETVGDHAFAQTALAEVTLPDRLVRLDTAAFADARLREIVIPASVTEIGQDAFAGCAKLEKITFAGSAPTIGSGSFTGVTAAAFYPQGAPGWNASTMKDYGGSLSWEAYENLAASGSAGETVFWRLSESGVLTFSGRGAIEDITGYADYKDSIAYVIIENGVTEIPENAFASFKKMTSLSLAGSVKVIGPAAFKSCTALESVTLSQGLTRIEASAFEGCSVMTDTVLPEKLSEIGDRAFYGCRKLTSVVFPESLQTLGVSAFMGCSKITEIRFLGCPAEIGENCFRSIYATVYYMPSAGWIGPFDRYGTTLYWAAIGEGDIKGTGVHWKVDENGLLTLSGRGAVPAYSLRYEENGRYAPWKDCRVVSVLIGSRITGIGEGAITGNGSLKSISVEASNRNFCVVDQLLYNKKQTSLIAYPAAAEGLGSCRLPGGLKRIEAGVFAESSLKLIRIPESVEYIGAYAFASCGELWNIRLPAGMETIERGTFAGCDALVSAVLPRSLMTVGEKAFAGCGLIRAAIPGSVRSIGDLAFADCAKLGEIRFEGNAPEIGTDAFLNVEADVYYPADDKSWNGVRSDYGGTLNWIAE